MIYLYLFLLSYQTLTNIHNDYTLHLHLYPVMMLKKLINSLALDPNLPRPYECSQPELHDAIQDAKAIRHQVQAPPIPGESQN